MHATSKGEQQGATFIVRLPLLVSRNTEAFSAEDATQLSGDNEEPSSAAESNPLLIDSSKLDGLRVLIVDDDADAREMLQVMLSQFGAEVRASSSTKAALKTLERWLPQILVSDIGMPDEDGYTLIQKVRESVSETIPAIALTGYARPEDRQQLLSAGYQAHLAKPVELTELVDVIARLAGRAGESRYALPEQ